ncbi:MAG: osmoprotectant NAGGN system M42 family peptidase [Hyphomicrobiaceae bacterium]|nr:osmoprotectant NAGGN system M42 family peptidase [Hyphomicrobiaceae bacterium]
MQRLEIDIAYLSRVLARLLRTPSPTGFTDAVVALVCEELRALDLPLELTRRGAIRANIAGVQSSPDRAIVTHVDTLGAMVKGLKDNGRLEIVPIGTWSSRFAEGARCVVYSASGGRYRGTVLPLKASGHVYNEGVDTMPVTWEHVEVRLDERVANRHDLMRLPIYVGDMIAIDTGTEFSENGFINSRHLDDKAGVACLLAAAKAVMETGARLPVDCHLLFTISEETGTGASHVLHGDVAEMVSIDNGTLAPGQNTSEYGATICMKDESGPFDWHLSNGLCELAREFSIRHSRDVFKYYRSDSASALEAGNDIRTALICFGLDASHGYERVHLDSLEAVANLIAVYMQSPPVMARQQVGSTPLAGE